MYMAPKRYKRASRVAGGSGAMPDHRIHRLHGRLHRHGPGRLAALILGLGVKAEHLLEPEAKKQLVEENTGRLKKEIEYRAFRW
jgi:hypothetical protein